MSLRLRLTLVYTTLIVGVLLTFGGLVYWMVNIMLTDQIDTSLTDNAAEIISLLHVNENNQFDVRSIAAFQPSENLVFQLWGNDHRLVLARPGSLTGPLDTTTQRSTHSVFNNSDTSKMHLRVLSVPLVNQRGGVGLLQLAVLLVLVAILAAFIASIWIWVVNGRALAPLATVTEVAMQISRTDDLSRRIPPASTTPGDEVDLLIQAFNSTLERLEQLFNSQRRFLADVSHELRTPLTVIKGNVGLMRKIGQTDEESLESIEAEVDRLTRMVGDLLLLAQAESGRVPMDNTPVELDTILLEVFQQMRLLAGERLQIRILEIDQVQVTGDRDRLKQVVLNLVANAVQYTPAGRQVSLALRKTEDQAQLIVSDTGPGIPAQDVPHIFERFYRGEKSRKRGQGSGFGLGLSIAYWIVRNHGGTIEVSSKEGEGTRFCVWLPLVGKNKPELVGVKE